MEGKNLSEVGHSIQIHWTLWRKWHEDAAKSSGKTCSLGRWRGTDTTLFLDHCLTIWQNWRTHSLWQVSIFKTQKAFFFSLFIVGLCIYKIRIKTFNVYGLLKTKMNFKTTKNDLFWNGRSQKINGKVIDMRKRVSVWIVWVMTNFH